uniref:Uncharacterized protein n=1 Tax=Arundo donax TaxID=35708 RepID=A0A0A9CH54_ARUDO
MMKYWQNVMSCFTLLRVLSQG